MYYMSIDVPVAVLFCNALEYSDQFRVVSYKSLDTLSQTLLSCLGGSDVDCTLSMDRYLTRQFISDNSDLFFATDPQDVDTGMDRFELKKNVTAKDVALKLSAGIPWKFIKVSATLQIKDLCHRLALSDLVTYLQVVTQDNALVRTGVSQQKINLMKAGVLCSVPQYEAELIELAKVVWSCVYSSGQRDVETTTACLHKSSDSLWQESPLESYTYDRYARQARWRQISGPVLSAADTLS